jgi:hypothetical protein
MNNWRVELRGVKEQRARMDKIVRDLHGTPMLQAMRDSTLMVTRTARKLAPHDRGILRNSIMPEIRTRGNTLEGVVGSNLKYAAAQELGTRPFWPPVAALQSWARRHGTSAFLVARAIATRGIKPKYFLQKGFGQNYYKIMARLERAVAQITRQ